MNDEEFEPDMDEDDGPGARIRALCDLSDDYEMEEDDGSYPG